MYATSRHPRGEGIPAPTRSVARAIAICLLAAWMLFAHREAAAQQFVFRHDQEREGISNLSVTCLLQDKEGFIWACTENGLYRYDGVAFERVGDAQGLGNSTIRAAVQDGAGTLWIGTAQDLYRRDGFHFRPIRPEGRSLKLGSGLRIAALSPDHLLVIDGAELLELTPAPGDGQWRIRTYFPQNLVHSMPALRSISSVYVDRLDRIWVGCDGAICRVEQGAVTIFDANFNVPLDTWSSWALDRDGRLWARGQAHLVVLEPDAARFESRDPPHARLTAGILTVPLVEDPQGRMLTSTDRGLSRWQNGWREYSGINGIPTTSISAILSSRDGQVWLGVPGLGVQRWLGYDHVESWTRAQGLGANTVWSIVPVADHSVLLATRAGCARLDQLASVVAPCPFDNLPPGEIRVMAQGRSALWFGTTTGELFRILTGDRNATWIAHVAGMRKFYVDSSDQLWIGTTGGVAVVAPHSTQIDSLQLPVPTGEVADITQDADGAIWLAGQGGLLRWSGGRWMGVRVDGEHAAAGFTAVAAAGGGWLWLGAASHGMVHVHVAGDRVDEMHWVTDLMLARGVVNFTGIDRRGWVWAGTDAGIVVFDGRVWRRLNTSDGVIWNDTMPNGFLADADGSVWIGTTGGLTQIKRPEALLQTAPIDLRITRVSLGGVALEPQSPPMPWGPNLFFNVHTSQLNYGKGSQSTKLHVRLRGLRDDWFEVPGHEVFLPALGPGKYTFEAVAIDLDHGQVSPVTPFSFEILPPWWRAVWFLRTVAIACLFSIVLVAVWNIRRGQERRRESERQRVEHEALVVRATRDALTGLWNRAAILGYAVE